MTEKVIHEIRFIETEDGFRIEVTGDKERMRKMGWAPGMGFGPGGHFWRRRWGGGKRGHWKHGPRFGPWNWWCWPDEDSGEDEAFEESPKDA